MKVYNGSGKYIYISYATKDFNIIEPIIVELFKRGFHIWFDRGIEFGSDWTEYNATKLIESSVVLMFVSKNFNESVNCKNEVTLALSKKKTMLAVVIEDFNLSPGLELQLANVQMLFLHKYNKNDFLDKFFNNDILLDKKLVSQTDYDFIDIELVERSIVANQIVVIGIVIKENDVLMVKRSVKEGNLLWQFPAAMARKTELPEEKIVREVYQETNIKTEFVNKIGSRIHPDTGVISIYMLLTYVSGEVYNKDDYENEDVKWVHLKEYESYITSNIFSGVKTYLDSLKNKVALAIVTKDNSEVLVIKRSNKEGNLLWQFPGGEIEDNETVFEACKRELLEETGINGNPIKLLGDRIHPYTNKHMSYVLCEYISGDIINKDEETEEVSWVKIKDLDTIFTTQLFKPVEDYLKDLIHEEND